MTEEMELRSATKKVLETPEILEMILALLDLRTLLTAAQRVCHTWLNLITESPSLQQALFLAPMKDSNSPSGNKERIFNPLLTEAFPSIFPPKDKPKGHELFFSPLPMTKDAPTMARFIRKDATWRKMLVQQPPISQIGEFHIVHGQRGDSAKSSYIPADQGYGDNGLRMERLLELLLFSHHIQFLGWTGTRLYWPVEQPISFSESGRDGAIPGPFRRMLGKFGLVVYTCTVMQCGVDPDQTPSAEELIRREIIAMYKEQGFDVEARSEAIQGLRAEVTDC